MTSCLFLHLFEQLRGCLLDYLEISLEQFLESRPQHHIDLVKIEIKGSQVLISENFSVFLIDRN